MQRRTHQHGFSILELLIAIAIIGILSTITISSINNIRDRGRQARAQVELKQIANAMTLLKNDTNLWPGAQEPDCYPTTAGGNEIENLNAATAGITQTHASFPGWGGPYMDEIPLDPWGTHYFFDTDYTLGSNEVAVLGSYGPNGIGNNLYDDDDVVLVMAETPC